jgi:hypothetical protein
LSNPIGGFFSTFETKDGSSGEKQDPTEQLQNRKPDHSEFFF